MKTAPESWESVVCRVERLRRYLKLRNNKFAAAIGMTPQNYGNLKKGAALLQVAVAVRVCLLTGADLDYIYRGDMTGLPDKLKLALLAPEPEPVEN